MSIGNNDIWTGPERPDAEGLQFAEQAITTRREGFAVDQHQQPGLECERDAVSGSAPSPKKEKQAMDSEQIAEIIGRNICTKLEPHEAIGLHDRIKAAMEAPRTVSPDVRAEGPPPCHGCGGPHRFDTSIPIPQPEVRYAGVFLDGGMTSGWFTKSEVVRAYPDITHIVIISTIPGEMPVVSVEAVRR